MEFSSNYQAAIYVYCTLTTFPAHRYLKLFDQLTISVELQLPNPQYHNDLMRNSTDILNRRLASNHKQ